MKRLSRVRLFTTPWTVACQTPLSMGFSRQEYWSGLPFPSPEDLPDPGIEPGSSALEADDLTSEPPGKLSQYMQKNQLTKFNIYSWQKNVSHLEIEEKKEKQGTRVASRRSHTLSGS